MRLRPWALPPCAAALLAAASPWALAPAALAALALFLMRRSPQQVADALAAEG